TQMVDDRKGKKSVNELEDELLRKNNIITTKDNEIKKLKRTLLCFAICSTFLVLTLAMMGPRFSHTPTRTVHLNRVHGKFGFQLYDSTFPTLQLFVSEVHPNSPAEGQLLVGDSIERVNGVDVEALPHGDIFDLIRNSEAVELVVSKKLSSFNNLEGVEKRAVQYQKSISECQKDLDSCYDTRHEFASFREFTTTGLNFVIKYLKQFYNL
ncbi:hypothetical protein PENTCL1PPCAC_10298, partial [Pristionchus entomophagus]